MYLIFICNMFQYTSGCIYMNAYLFVECLFLSVVLLIVCFVYGRVLLFKEISDFR